MNSEAIQTEPERGGNRFAGALRWVGLVGLLSIAVARCLIFFVPQVWFETDPAADSGAMTGLGPAGSLALDALLLAFCAVGMVGEWMGGRRADWKAVVLALVPAPIVLWHGSHDAGNLWLGSAWLSAAVAAATIAHMARQPTMRILVIAVLLATLAPMIGRGVSQITYEHAGTVELFEQTKEQFLRERGWEPGSSAAKIYERRLRQPQPIAWFTTSNIFASFMALGIVFSLGLAVAAAKAKMQSGWAGAMALVSLAAGAMLVLTGSKGAALACAAGLAFLGGMLASDRIRKRAAIIAAILVIAALGGVVARGLLPEGFLGEKSLLFRWHYMIAAARTFAERPWTGVGPDGFQAAYMLHRVPRSPEEVMSAHSVFIDWLCTLGVSGIAWIALVGVFIARSKNLFRCQWNERAHAVDAQAGTATPADSRSYRAIVRAVIAIMLLAIVSAGVVEVAAIDGRGLVVRIIGAMGFVAIGVIAAAIMLTAEARWIAAAALAAVTALLAHAQIEMTFFQPGAAAWCMCAIGVIGSRGAAARSQTRLKWPAQLVNALLIAAIACVASWVAANGALPALAQQQAMAHAARLLEPLRKNPDDAELMIRDRKAAADALVRAYQIWRTNVQPLDAAAIQLQLACSKPNGPQPLGLLMQGRDLIEQAIREHNKSSSMVIGISINAQLAAMTGDAEYWRAAIDTAREMTQRDPSGLGAWRRLGDVLWAAGQHAEAANAYRRALECDANFALDELKQLSPNERQRLQNRIDRAGK